MTTTYTFVNATAARLFAEWWNREYSWPVEVDGNVVSRQAGGQVQTWFQDAARAFNAASQSAREIAGEDHELD